MITSFNLSFCKAEIHEDYVLTVMSEGITVIPQYKNLLSLAVEKYYKDKPFFYISNRVNSYSVNPAVHHEIAKIPNLVGVAVISKNPLQEIQIQLEKSFFKKEFKLFSTLKSALEWKNEIIKRYTY
ncbi:hypothetical protein [Aquimarina sp. MMG016]|uniref:hypothetical protein n=1 Tax=Aquimarina sp. MMG016 TaxID=2822690 RepID=UPI001B3A16F6|nr:hypothetical protein [Aquimarina sp. MMG016]MBQ4821258.1 hypothetical protein [Aquimarina sp. MMG016]